MVSNDVIKSKLVSYAPVLDKEYDRAAGQLDNATTNLSAETNMLETNMHDTTI
jgi:hypothetical protein